MAIDSAWGRPPGAVAPRPSIRPPRTITAPTVGFGQVSPSPRLARPIATRIQRASSISGFFCCHGRAQLRDEILEVICRLKVLVDACEAHIGDGIDPGQRIHHDLADLRGDDIRLARALQPAHDPRNHLLHAVRLDRAFLQGNPDRARELVAVEGLAPSGLLDDNQVTELDTLECREAPFTGRAGASPPDRGMILGRSRILHLRVGISTKRAAHSTLHPGPDHQQYRREPTNCVAACTCNYMCERSKRAMESFDFCRFVATERGSSAF